MTQEEIIIMQIQSHWALEDFDYSLAVNWAIKLIENGQETDDILMLAGFGQPIDREEIRPYVSAALKDQHLLEYQYEKPVIAMALFPIIRILKGKKIRDELSALYRICADYEFDASLYEFYLLYHAWGELEEIGENYYYEGANLSNIAALTQEEAIKWVSHNINENALMKKQGLYFDISLLHQPVEVNKAAAKVDKPVPMAEKRPSTRSKPWWKRLWS